MHSAFDSPLKVVDGVVEACGELGWDAGETEAVVVTVTLIQEGEGIAGTASSPPNFSRSDDDEWMFEVRPTPAHQKFKEGSAHAMGVIRATGDDIADVFHWSQDVELEA